MIRRHAGSEFWLVTQHDHAVVSGQLAQQLGRDGLEAPPPRTIRGIALHDCGWPLHDDDAPTLSAQQLPLDVFESPPRVAMTVWPESARRAAAEDAYAGLLVSLHVLSLSVLATTPTAVVHEKFDLQNPATRFDVNKFQQQQIELQEDVRRALGMRTDEPRRFGLAEQSADQRERQLVFDFRLLQAMDKLSLAICCTKPPAETIEPLHWRVGGPNRPLKVARMSDFEMTVSPWPFGRDRVVVAVPFKRLPARAYESEQAFRDAYRAAAVERFEFTLREA